VTQTLITMSPVAVFATANITSVRTAVIRPQVTSPLLLMLGGAVAVVGAAPYLASEAAPSLCVLGLGLAAVVGGVLWWRSLKPTYVLLIASAGGEVEGLRSRDWQFVDAVAAAVIQAIHARG
jgi:hypothetical protein